MSARKKFFTRDDLKGHLVPVTNKFSSRILEERYITDDGYTVGVIVDFSICRVWVTDRHGRGQTSAEFCADGYFCPLYSLGADNDERFNIVQLIDKFLFQIAQTGRDVAAEEKALILEALTSYVGIEDDWPGADRQRRVRNVAIGKLEAATEICGA